MSVIIAFCQSDGILSSLHAQLKSFVIHGITLFHQLLVCQLAVHHLLLLFGMSILVCLLYVYMPCCFFIFLFLVLMFGTSGVENSEENLIKCLPRKTDFFWGGDRRAPR